MNFMEDRSAEERGFRLARAVCGGARSCRAATRVAPFCTDLFQGRNTSLRALLLGVFLLAGVLYAPVVLAASASAPPRTGLEGGERHSYGPGVESRSEQKIMGGGVMDAYGNPVLPGEEDTAPRQRLRGGAYGSRPAPEVGRPLPSVPGTDAGWKFK